MQLFHLSSELFHIQGDTLELFPIKELISQLRKVLRMKKGDSICVQFNDKTITTRYTISITNRTDEKLIGTIIENQIFQNESKQTGMLIAMPNKREKAELIVQKLTEIGINDIGFRVSEHSIIRQRNNKKAERLDKISREAVEQSRGLSLPEIKFYDQKSLKQFIEGKEVYLANMGGDSILSGSFGDKKDLYGVIGPEGGFGKSDLELFANAKIISLGKGILRMETAAIVMSRILKNK